MPTAPPDLSPAPGARHARLLGVAGALLGLLGVAAGAFGAHGLKGSLTPARLANWDTAAHYQLIHALALIAVASLAARAPSRATLVAGWAFFVGVLLFSGSLYALALSDVLLLGAVTPFGGVGFLVGWGALAFAFARAPRR